MVNEERLKKTKERVYTVSSKPGGSGDICGHCHFPKRFIGKKFRFVELTETQYKNVYNIREESKKNIEMRNEKLKKHIKELNKLRNKRVN